MVERLVFGLWPGESAATEIVEALQELRNDGCGEGRAQRPDRYHLTLNCVGDHSELPIDVVESARHIATQLRFAAFDVWLDRIGSYTGARGAAGLITLQGDAGVIDVVRLQRKLADEMRRGGLGKYVRKGPFTPHISLLYGARPMAQRSIRPVRWTVREFLLVHSEVGRTRHHRLGEWPLQA